MSKTLADILGWEEGATYKLEGLYYSVVGEKLYYFKDFESSRIKTNQDIIIDCSDFLELANEAERIELKKYYLRHKFLGEGGDSYLNYNYDRDKLCLMGMIETPNYQTQFTDDAIEEMEATIGFDLCNFEKVEVEEDDE